MIDGWKVTISLQFERKRVAGLILHASLNQTFQGGLFLELLDTQGEYYLARGKEKSLEGLLGFKK